MKFKKWIILFTLITLLCPNLHVFSTGINLLSEETSKYMQGSGTCPYEIAPYFGFNSFLFNLPSFTSATGDFRSRVENNGFIKIDPTKTYKLSFKYKATSAQYFNFKAYFVQLASPSNWVGANTITIDDITVYTQRTSVNWEQQDVILAPATVPGRDYTLNNYSDVKFYFDVSALKNSSGNNNATGTFEAAGFQLQEIVDIPPKHGKYRLSSIKYNNPGLITDLGAGLYAYPIPMDCNNDGKLDLMISSPSIPSGGIYYFENTGNKADGVDVFKAPVQVSWAENNLTASYINNQATVTSARGAYFKEFATKGVASSFPIPGLNDTTALATKYKTMLSNTRGNSLKYVDYNNDGVLDIMIGISDSSDYYKNYNSGGNIGGYNSQGVWQGGNLHGYVYLIMNSGTNESPIFGDPVKLQAGGTDIDVYGDPNPQFADFNGDGKPDIICGEFVDRFTFFENVGTKENPQFAAGKYLQKDGKDIKMDLCMINPIAIDWNNDGKQDLVVGQEGGRVALLLNESNSVGGVPNFSEPIYFKQQADEVKIDSLATPVYYDWDGDGLNDIISGDSAGYITFIKNLGGTPPKWAAPEQLKSDNQVIRIQAGTNGSLQGPDEQKWGYTVLSVADWDNDGLPDIIANSIWGKVIWYKNVGTRTLPILSAAQPIEVEWDGATPKPAGVWWNPAGKELVTQWRTKPEVVDLNNDGLQDLVITDYENYLAFFERKLVNGQLKLYPGKRIFKYEDGTPIKFDATTAGYGYGLYGRRQAIFTDYDLDGKVDILLDSLYSNVEFLKNVSSANDSYTYKNMGVLDIRTLAGHTTSPTIVDWDNNKIPDVLIGAEDGHLYYAENSFLYGNKDLSVYSMNLVSDSTFKLGRWTASGTSLASGQVVSNGGPNGESAYKITFNSGKAGANATFSLNNAIDKISKTSDSSNPYYLVSFQYKVKMSQDGGSGTAISFSLKDGYTTSGAWKEYKFFNKYVYSFNSSDEWKTYTAVFGNGLNDVAGTNNWNAVGADDTLIFNLLGQPTGDIYLANIKIKRISQSIYDSMYNKSLTSAQKITDYNFSQPVQLKYGEPNFTSDSPMPTSEFKMQKLDTTYTSAVARGWTQDVFGGKYAILLDLSKLSKSSKYRILWDKTPFKLDGDHYYKISYSYFATNASSTKIQFINYANSLNYAIDDYNISGSNFGWQTRTAYFGKDLIDSYLNTGWQGAASTAFYFDIINNSSTSDGAGTIAITDLQIEEISGYPNNIIDTFEVRNGGNKVTSFSDNDQLNVYAKIEYLDTSASPTMKKATVILAYYDTKGTLIGIKTKQLNATITGGRANISVSTDPIAVTGKVKTVKAFIWNDFNSIASVVPNQILAR